MSKAVLISIRPKWCELIASGKKTIEVRKTKPNTILPLKVYIYQTKEGKENPVVTSDGGETFHILTLGKVIGEFVCDSISRLDIPFPAYWDQVDKATLDAACLTYGEAHNYLGHRTGWAWHISDLKIYDTPKELSEFSKPCLYDRKCLTCPSFFYPTYDNDGRIVEPGECGWFESLESAILKPPQSWRYVEEV